MKHPSRSRYARACTLALLLSLSITFPAAAFPVFDAANFAQNVLQAIRALVQIANQITQIQHQVSQLETMYRNLERFEDPSWRDLNQQLIYLNELTLQGEALSYAIEGLFDEFRILYPGLVPTHPADFRRSYDEWTTIALDTLAATLDSAAGQAGDYEATQEQLAELMALANASDGHLEALNASNMFSGHIAQEIAKLNQLSVASLNAQNVYYGTQLNLEANREATARWLFEESREDFHVYTGHGGFTGLPPEWPYSCVGCGNGATP